MATSALPPEDQNVIELGNPAVFRWWCGRLGCSDLRLISAVGQAGSDPRRVSRYLRLERLFGRSPSAEELQDEMAQFSEGGPREEAAPEPVAPPAP